MLRLSMFFLVCAVCCGVFGFGGGVAPSWFIARGLFFVCFIVAMTTLAYGTMGTRERWQTLEREHGIYFG